MRTSTLLGLVAIGGIGYLLVSAEAPAAQKKPSTSGKPKPGTVKTPLAVNPFVEAGPTLVQIDPKTGLVPGSGNPQESWSALQSRLMNMADNQDAKNLITAQFQRGFVPGWLCNDQYADWEDYVKSLGEFGLDQISTLPIDMQSALTELGQKTIQYSNDPWVLAMAKKVADTCFGEIGSSTFSAIDQRTALAAHTDPASLAGAVAAAMLKKDPQKVMPVAVNAQQAYWSANSNLPPNGHLYALAQAWNAAKNYK